MVTAVENSPSYPSFFINGIRIEPKAEVSAVEEPDIPPKNILAKIFTIANPPLIHPIKAFESLINLVAIPPAPIISPESIKNGTARSANTLMPLTIF